MRRDGHAALRVTFIDGGTGERAFMIDDPEMWVDP
jgi:hypothetical protein